MIGGKDSHEKLEKDDLFPRFEKAEKLTDLIRILRTQPRAGRRLTDAIKERALRRAMKTPAERDKLSNARRLFIHRYRSHAAREATVLFPAFGSLLFTHELAALGEAFEDKEYALFGKEEFERIVAEVAELERMLGIDALAGFTAPLD